MNFKSPTSDGAKFVVVGIAAEGQGHGALTVGANAVGSSQCRFGDDVLRRQTVLIENAAGKVPLPSPTKLPTV